jgi:hypothetical protein
MNNTTPAEDQQHCHESQNQVKLLFLLGTNQIKKNETEKFNNEMKDPEVTGNII